MSEIAMAMPMLPEKRDALKQFAIALMGERKAEFEASQVSVKKESWFLQITPMGDFVIIHFEAPDIAAVFGGLAASQDAFDIWFRDQVKDITGLDLTQFPIEALPERVFDWSRSAG